MLRLAIAIAACSVAASCSSQHDRAATHAEQGEAYLEQSLPTEALIEFHSALKLDPENPDYAEQIATILIAQGEITSARFYLGEVYRVAPEREGAAVRLALTLLATDPEEADALLSEVIERNPGSAWGQIGRAEQALFGSDIDDAATSIDLAIQLDPDLADVHWHRARVALARIREQQLSRQPVDPALFEGTLNSLQRFAELDPGRSWIEISARARLLATWPGREDEAEATLREASQELGELELPDQEYEILDAAIEMGRRAKRPALRRWAYKRKIEIAPTDYDAWDALANWRERGGGSGDIVYSKLIDRFPGEAEPYLRYARFLRTKEGPQAAIRYLRRRIAANDADDPALLAEIVHLQLAAGRQERAFEAVSQLVAGYPDSREAVLMAAWQLAASGNPQQALGLLSDHDWTEGDVAALQIAIDAHLRRHDSLAALATLEQALAIMPRPDPRSLRLRANLLHDLGRYDEARGAYTRLSALGPLELDERARLAYSYIATGGRAVGIRMLETLVDEPKPKRRAVLLLAREAGRSPEQHERLRAGFASLLAEYKHNRDLLEAFVLFEIGAGQPGRARDPLLRALRHGNRKKLPPGRLELLLAMVERAEGDREAARARVLEIIAKEPRLPGALDFASSLYPTKEEAVAAIREITEEGKKREFAPATHALLGRLHYRAGNLVLSRWAYEQALTGGLELPTLKNDLAFLLAKQKRDLERARLLAQQAAQALPNEPGVIDTLGFVLLELQDYEGALTEFERADQIARGRGLPRSTVQYHLGLALNALARSTEAERAFATALELDEEFPEHEATRRELATLRGEI